MSDNGMSVDPDLVQQAYKGMLADSQSEVALLRAAATQLQQQVNQLATENKELKATNKKLLGESGRQDGVPQGPAEGE